MCDELTQKDVESFLSKHGITRRQFSVASTGAALSMLLPPTANAANVVEQDVSVPTPDGMADCYFVHPDSSAHAAVIVWPDIVSIRPAFRAMGKRLAESGYAVLVVNPYYRTHKGQIVPDGKGFRDPGIRELLMPHARSLSPATCVSDGRAFVAWLDEQTAVDSSRMMGSTGYCMTGAYPLRLAAAMPERVAAGGSFHAGNLAKDGAQSPHSLVKDMSQDAGFVIAIAENDDERDPTDKTELRKAFDAAGVAAEIEVYANTLHGWCPPDSAAYNQAQAERAWARLLNLFENKLA